MQDLTVINSLDQTTFAPWMRYIVLVNPKSHPIMNDQIVFRFENGYGASVVRGRGSYGGISGLFELAVVRFNSDDPDDFDLVHDTDITDDVLGWLSGAEVIGYLSQIQQLTPEGKLLTDGNEEDDDAVSSNL